MAMDGAALPIVRWLARAVTWIFYRVDQAGRVPNAGAVLLLPNHPNSLLDPAIVWATAGRDVRFLAKSTLFDTALAPVLEAGGAIPVYRRLDQGVDTSRNAETFEAVDRAFAGGDAVCIFPEGISHSTGKLVPLRTGAARMALSAERQGVSVRLVAAGLNFDRKTAFRSRVTVLYGAPFSVADLASIDDEQKAARAVTDRIATEIRRLLVEADPDGDARLVLRVERLYGAARGRPANAEERVARRQAIATGIERLRQRDEERYEEIALKLTRYDQRLRRFGLRDSHLDWDISAGAALRFAVREILLGVVLVPIAGAGLAIFWIPYHATGRLARLATKERDVAATATVFVGAAVYAAWQILLAFLVWRALGARAAAIAAATIPMLALAGLFALDREAAVIDAARSWLALRRARGRSRAWLKQERSEIAGMLEEVYDWLSVETTEPSAGQKPS